MKKTTRIKTDAAAISLRDEHEVDAAIAQVGQAQRIRAEIETRMNAELAATKERYEAEAAPHAAVIAMMGDAIRIYCEGRREALTRDGRTKTVKFGAGEVAWRVRPPRVVVRGEGIVLEALKRLGLSRFIRVKEELDKNAILAEPDAVQDLKGLSITRGEDFVIKPFASELEEVR